MNSHLNNIHPSNEFYTPIQLKLPLDVETLISFDDPIYAFDEVMKGCNFKKYIKSNYGSVGRNGF